MTEAIKVRRADIRSILAATFPDYRGRKFTVDPSGRVTFSDLHLGGGSRNEYKAVRLDGMKVGAVPIGSPWDSPAEGVTVEIPIGVLVVEHTWFCGQDCGIRVYCNPGDLRSRMLPPKRCPSCGGDGLAEAEWAGQFTDTCEACEGTGKVEPARFDESSHFRAEG